MPCEERVVSGGLEDGTGGDSLLAALIVHDDDVARLQLGNEKLPEIVQDARSVENTRWLNAFMAESCEESHSPRGRPFKRAPQNLDVRVPAEFRRGIRL